MIAWAAALRTNTAAEQDDENVHVVLADPALGVHEVAGQGAGPTAVARVQRPLLTPPHGPRTGRSGSSGPWLSFFLGARRGPLPPATTR